MRILIPWYRFPPFSENSIGGLSVSMYELCCNLSNLGHAVEVLVPPNLNAERKESIGSITVTRDHPGEQLVANENLESTKFFDNYDIILSIDNFGGRGLRSLMKDKRVVRQIHTVARDRPVSSYLSLKSGLTEYLKMYVLRRREIARAKELKGCRSICVSRFLLDKMIDFGVESEGNLIHVPNGIDTQLFCRREKEALYDLLFVGRFQKAKGLDILIETLNMLYEKGRNLKLGIAGTFDAEERKFCLGLARLTVRKGIEFLGKVPHEEMPEVLNSSKVLVAPSTYESFCLPALEAMACGVTVIGTRVGGIPELIDDTVGLIAEPENEMSLAKCISRAMDESKFQENALIHGPLKAVGYDWHTVSEIFYSELVS